MINLVVLISGSGSNLQAIMDAIACGHLDARVAAVISNKTSAYGLTRAQSAGIPTAVLQHRDYDSREAFDAQLQQLIDGFSPDCVVLAGFMRILSKGFVAHYQGRLLNIHPSLLPLHKGLDTHARALEAGDRQHGCSVHFVTDELDGGPVIAQGIVDVQPEDTPETLAERVHMAEHRLYPLVLSWLSQNKLCLNQGQIIFQGKALAEPQTLYFST